MRRVFEDDVLPHERLDVLALLVELGKATLFLLVTPKDAEKNRGRMKVAAALHVMDVDQPGVTDGDFPSDDFTDLALQ